MNSLNYKITNLINILSNTTDSISFKNNINEMILSLFYNINNLIHIIEKCKSNVIIESKIVDSNVFNNIHKSILDISNNTKLYVLLVGIAYFILNPCIRNYNALLSSSKKYLRERN